jgi:hypothetical protein
VDVIFSLLFAEISAHILIVGFRIDYN